MRWAVSPSQGALLGEAPFCGRSWATFHLPFSLCTASSGPPSSICTGTHLLLCSLPLPTITDQTGGFELLHGGTGSEFWDSHLTLAHLCGANPELSIFRHCPLGPMTCGGGYFLF